MRGFGNTFSRLPAARALIAGAAILAGATVTKAEAQTQAAMDDTAFAVPRVDPRGFSGVSLPRPLPPSEASRIQRIFALQGRGDMNGAVRETAELDTSTEIGQAMLGHILANRYLGPATRPSPEELQIWLRQWASLPDARAIHALLLTRLPKGSALPQAPNSASLAQSGGHDLAVTVPVPEESEPASFTLARNPSLDRSVHEAARARGAAGVQKLLASTAGLTSAYASQLRGEAAQILFTLNRDAEAYTLGHEGMLRCGNDGCADAALAGYIAGLAAWRMDRPELARPMFEQAWRAELTTPSLRSAAAFWAARTQLRTGRPLAYQPWLNRASAEPSTFYGLLARRTVGLGFGLMQADDRDTREVLSEADIEAVAATPEGLRAFALLQVGQMPRAEAELRQLWPAATTSPSLGRAIMLVAHKAGLTQLAAQLADLVQSTDGRPRDAERFAVPRLQPDGGFRIDPAMVYGIARTESNFNTALVSNAGATGLMQIMPDTASFLTGREANGSLRGSLRDPGVNLDLGQRYVAYLAQNDGVNGDLLRLLASYNSGPGHFGHWSGSVQHGGDPLLFIEAIPVDETRAFVPRVLTYTWLYAARMGLATPSLDELAAGMWPRYYAWDTSAMRQAVLH
jgi:soluble lytic murein transglycosylase-like protein